MPLMRRVSIVLFLGLCLGACGVGPLGTLGGDGTSADDGPEPLPDVSDAEVFLGAPAAHGGGAGGTGGGSGAAASAGARTPLLGIGGTGRTATLSGGAAGSSGGAGTLPCPAPGVEQVDVTVTELGNPDLEEQLFGTTPAKSVVKERPKQPCGPHIVVPKPLAR